MNRRSSLMASLFFFAVSCTVVEGSSGGKVTQTDSMLQLPIAGNTYAQNVAGRSRIITNNGIEAWTDKQVQFDTYLRISQPGTIKISLNAKTEGESSLQLLLNGKKKTITVRGNAFQRYDAGEWKIRDTGYIRISLSGLSKTGENFAEVSSYEIGGTAINAKTAYVKNNEGNFFYWGRRGPSVHLNYPFSDTIKAKWFYNEITVPKDRM